MPSTIVETRDETVVQDSTGRVRGGEKRHGTGARTNQTVVRDPSGTVVGGEKEQGVHSGDSSVDVEESNPLTGGTIAGGLGGSEVARDEQVTAISDQTHTTVDGERVHTTDVARDQVEQTFQDATDAANDALDDVTNPLEWPPELIIAALLVLAIVLRPYAELGAAAA